LLRLRRLKPAAHGEWVLLLVLHLLLRLRLRRLLLLLLLLRRLKFGRPAIGRSRRGRRRQARAAGARRRGLVTSRGRRLRSLGSLLRVDLLPRCNALPLRFLLLVVPAWLLLHLLPLVVGLPRLLLHL
jgi:hypothetical protein